jgi:nucleotide-binding universal stress UspA family protein
MFTAVVVPLDGSELSETALTPARAVASRLGVPIKLLTSSWGGATGDSQEYLDRIALQLDLRGTASVVIADRFAAGAIADVASGETEPLVCMATHGRTGIGRALLGSTAEEVIRSIDGPVLLVGPKSEPLPAGGATELVITIDGSAMSASAVALATEVATTVGLAVVVVTVLEDATVAAVDDPHGLDVVVAGVRAAGLDARSETLSGKDPADVIAEFAGERPAPIICMATHGRGGLERTALGSVAMKVVHQVTCPVLVVRPPSDPA